MAVNRSKPGCWTYLLMLLNCDNISLYNTAINAVLKFIVSLFIILAVWRFSGFLLAFSEIPLMVYMIT